MHTSEILASECRASETSIVTPSGTTHSSNGIDTTDNSGTHGTIIAN